MAERARHAFGNSENLQSALNSGVIDAYDILFLDGDTKPKVGWVDKAGEIKVVDTDTSDIEAELAKKASAAEVEEKIGKAVTDTVTTANAYTDEKLEAALGEYLAKKYEIAHKPEGVIVNFRDKEIRVMCPANTEWQLQNSGEGADSNKYYIGFRAYAPQEAVSFKEDLAKTIADEEMYYFEGNEFAGVDGESGRKYSIVWLPVAKYDETSATWTYYGASSSEEKYIGWHYSVEWYDANDVMIASDCIRINLTNEGCHSSIEPYYVSDMMKEIETKIAEASAIEVVEF